MQHTDFAVLTEILTQRKSEQAVHMKEDEFFEFFTAQQALREHQLDPEEISSGIVGQSTQSESPGTDGGIDAMYLLVNGRLIRDLEQAEELKNQKQNVVLDVVIVQSSLESGFALQRVLRLKDTSESIFRVERSPSEFSEHYNEPLLDCIARFRAAHRALITKHPTINVTYFYATRGDSSKVSEDVEKKARSLEGDIPNILATITNTTFTFVGARDLISLYRKPPKRTFSLKCTNSMKSGRGYLALVKLSEYCRMITSDKGELLEYLFESNVRDYQGDVEVNKQIRETLEKQNDTAEFWWLNNGITILASQIGGETYELTITEPQIVNGLQTSMEIFEHLRLTKASPAADRHAVIRLIESPETEQQDRIIKATNSQTKIPPQYLWATDERQRDIEQIFRASGMHYDRKKNSWQKTTISLDRVVGMTELAQSVAAIYLQEPDHARARPSRYFKKEHYKKVFGPKVSMDLYTACALLRKRAEAFLKDAEPDRKDRNNLLFYLLMAIVSLELKTPRAKANSIAGPKIQNLKRESFESALAFVRPLYESHGSSDNAAKGPDLVVALKAKLISEFSKKKKLSRHSNPTT